MNDHTDKEKTEHERTIEREARMGMHFSMEHAILRSAGGGLMRGGTPVPPYDEALHKVRVFLDRHLSDAVMETAMDDWIGLHRKQLENNLEQPLQGLLEILEHLLGRESAFTEFVRIVDFNYGQIMQERPHFQQPGESPDPEDEYTFASVRETLHKLVEICRERLR